MNRDELNRAKILIVDDDADNVRLLECLLSSNGYTHLRSTTDSRQALGLFQEFQPDLILLDLNLPGFSGYEVIAQLRPLIPEGDYRPILVLTAETSLETRRQALWAGAKEFLTKPFLPVEALLRIAELIETRERQLRLQQRNAALEAQLLQAQRLASLGPLMGGIAHELNAVLAPILVAAPVLRDDLPADQWPVLDLVVTSARRAVKMVERMLRCARASPGERLPLDSLYLPALVEPAAKAGLAESRPSPGGKDELILIIEDEAVIREAAQRLLEARGYRVLAGADGTEGVALFVAHQNEVQLVLCDMAMPHLDGPATIGVLRRIDPGVRIIGAGESNPGPGDDRVTALGLPLFLAKPFGAEELLLAVHEVLTSSP